MSRTVILEKGDLVETTVAEVKRALEHFKDQDRVLVCIFQLPEPKIQTKQEIGETIIEQNEKEQIPDPDLLEKIASIEHDQWIYWSKSLALSSETLSQERRDRWRRLWRTRYPDLSEEMKEQDRVWARKVLEVISLHMQNGGSE